MNEQINELYPLDWRQKGRESKSRKKEFYQRISGCVHSPVEALLPF